MGRTQANALHTVHNFSNEVSAHIIAAKTPNSAFWNLLAVVGLGTQLQAYRFTDNLNPKNSKAGGLTVLAMGENLISRSLILRMQLGFPIWKQRV